MELIKIIDGLPVPYSLVAFRADNRHTVYGAAISNRHLNAQDVYRVSVAIEPVVPVGQKAVKDTMPTQDASGNWVLGWTLAPLSEGEIKSLRNKMLSETDWWAVSDRVTTDAETAYRQALRNIPQQAGFPNDVVWPVNPNEAHVSEEPIKPIKPVKPTWLRSGRVSNV